MRSLPKPTVHVRLGPETPRHSLARAPGVSALPVTSIVAQVSGGQTQHEPRNQTPSEVATCIIVAVIVVWIVKKFVCTWEWVKRKVDLHKCFHLKCGWNLWCHVKRLFCITVEIVRWTQQMACKFYILTGIAVFLVCMLIFRIT